MDSTSPEISGLATTGARSPAVGINQGIINTGDTTVQAPLVLPPPADVSAPHGVHNLPRPVGHRFVGRKTEMAALERALEPRYERATTHVVTQAMSGLGGIGKSTLALHFAHTHRSDYTAVWWIDAETPETITGALAQLTTRLNPGTNTNSVPSAALAEWALTWFDTHSGWLLVFDNATHPDHLAPYLARLTSGDHLITSRRTYGWHDLAATPLHLDVLTPSAAISLLHQLAGPTDSSEPAGAQELADELGHLPLALEQAGAYIHRTRNTYSGYLCRLRTQAARMLNTPGNGDPHSITIARTWRITLDTIAERDPLAVHLLRVMAWLAPYDIPRELFSSLAEEPGREDDALALLHDFSMITLRETTAAIHRLVQTVARTPDPDDPYRTHQAIQEAWSTATTLIRSALPDDPKNNTLGWSRWRILLPHIDSYLTHTRPDTDTEDTDGVLHNTALFLRGQGQFSQAISYAQRSANASSRLHGEDHADTLVSRNGLAGAYIDAGDLDRAIPLFEQTLAMSIRVLGEDHRETLTIRNNLAAAYQAAGDVDRAIPLHEQTLADRLQALGENHPDTLTSRNNLAVAYQAAGDVDRAIPLYEQTLADRLQALGENHPDIPASLNNLAHAYQDIEELDRATPLFEQGLRESIRILGKDHPRVLDSRHSLAHVYLAAGDHNRAIPMLEQHLSECIRVLGKDHPNTLTARYNLAAAYKKAGHLDRAIPVYEEGLAEYTRVLGEDNPNTLVFRNNLAVVYQSAGDLGRAIPIHERGLSENIRVLGKDHPETLTARYNLAAAYKKAGHLDRAIPVYRKALSESVRVLGKDHPNTLTTRNDLAHIYQTMRNLGRAIPLYEQTLTGRQRVLGKDHPDTLITRNNLAYAYDLAGDLGRAIPMYEQTLTDSIRVLGRNHPTTRVVQSNLRHARSESQRHGASHSDPSG
ncbi:FxSxx-COOH system tetratricopeptide repeat protein [Streptomyces sp. NEAU-174]|uniref:FxSxx-COOH system tetratricopeptide repeat protein n=1 Tax=Streptomyces sp. NEAU-174 TaxID=3458254 RepID=UPI004044FB87